MNVLKRKLFYLCSAVIFLFFYFSAFSQTPDYEKDLNTNIPELEKLNNLFSTGFNANLKLQNGNELRSLSKQVNLLSDSLFEARLPGILVVKASRWSKAIRNYKQSLTSYNNAIKDTSAEIILKVSSDLTLKQSLLSKTLKTPLPELDDFYKTLYIVRSFNIPKKELVKVKNASAELINKARAIASVKATGLSKKKQREFETEADNLIISSKNLIELCGGMNYKEIAAAVEALQMHYEKIDDIFN